MMVWFHRILNTPNVSDIVVLFGPYLPYGAYDPNKPIGSTVVRHFVHIVIDRIPSPNSIFHISSIVVWGNVPLPRFECPGTIIDRKDFDGMLLIQQKDIPYKFDLLGQYQCTRCRSWEDYNIF